jgi:3-oxoacyl-[acyl-carrier-protein] synthase II
MGEGAGIMVLESQEHARARGAHIYAELAGAGVSSDAHHIAAPDPVGAGAARAMVEALDDGDLKPRDVTHINAHATSTPVGDVAEVAAIRAAMAEAIDTIAVSATKGSTGHLLGAAGAVEAIFTVLALRDRIAPPTINLDVIDPAISLDVVGAEPRSLGVSDTEPLVALSNSFGFGGHNVALAFRSAR